LLCAAATLIDLHVLVYAEWLHFDRTPSRENTQRQGLIKVKVVAEIRA
jgi:hypothetical protein